MLKVRGKFFFQIWKNEEMKEICKFVRRFQQIFFFFSSPIRIYRFEPIGVLVNWYRPRWWKHFVHKQFILPVKVARAPCCTHTCAVNGSLGVIKLVCQSKLIRERQLVRTTKARTHTRDVANPSEINTKRSLRRRIYACPPAYKAYMREIKIIK